MRSEKVYLAKISSVITSSASPTKDGAQWTNINEYSFTFLEPLPHSSLHKTFPKISLEQPSRHTSSFQHLEGVYTTLPASYRRLIDFETTSCVCWEFLLLAFSFHKVLMGHLLKRVWKSWHKKPNTEI